MGKNKERFEASQNDGWSQPYNDDGIWVSYNETTGKYRIHDAPSTDVEQVPVYPVQNKMAITAPVDHADDLQFAFNGNERGLVKLAEMFRGANLPPSPATAYLEYDEDYSALADAYSQQELSTGHVDLTSVPTNGMSYEQEPLNQVNVTPSPASVIEPSPIQSIEAAKHEERMKKARRKLRTAKALGFTAVIVISGYAYVQYTEAQAEGKVAAINCMEQGITDLGSAIGCLPAQFADDLTWWSDAPQAENKAPQAPQDSQEEIE